MKSKEGAKRFLAWVLCTVMLFSGNGIIPANAGTVQKNAGNNVEISQIASKEAAPPQSKSVVQLTKDIMENLEVALYIDGQLINADTPVEEIDPIDPEETDVLVLFNNMKFVDHQLTDDTVYEISLPEELTPDFDETVSDPADTEWKELVSSSSVKAWGRVIFDGSDYKFQIKFQKTEGQSNIRADFQYRSHVNAGDPYPDQVSPEFPWEQQFTLPLKQETVTVQWLEKQANWLNAQGQDVAADNAGSNSNGFQQIRYTVTLTNQNTDVTAAASGQLKETLGVSGDTGGILAWIRTGNIGSTPPVPADVKKWLTVKADGKEIEMAARVQDGRLMLVGEDEDGGQLKLDFGPSTSPFVSEGFTLSFTDLTFQTLTFSYLAYIYDNGNGSSVRSYTAKTEYIPAGGSEAADEVSKTARKTITGPGVSLKLSHGTDTTSSGSYSAMKPKFQATLHTSGNENWLELSEKAALGTSEFAEHFYYFNASNFYTGTPYILKDFDFRVTDVNGYSASLQGASNSSSYSGSPSKMKAYDPIAYRELDSRLKKEGISGGVEGWNSGLGQLHIFDIEYKDNSGNLSGKRLWIVVAPKTALAAQQEYVGIGPAAAMQDENGKAAGYTIWLFNVGGIREGAVDYTKYLRRLIPYDPKNGVYVNQPVCFSTLTATNGYNSSSGNDYDQAMPLTAPTMAKEAYVQVDGTVRWDLTLDMNNYNTFYQYLQANGFLSVPPSLFVLHDLVPAGYEIIASWDSELNTNTNYDVYGKKMGKSSSGKIFVTPSFKSYYYDGNTSGATSSGPQFVKGNVSGNYSSFVHPGTLPEPSQNMKPESGSSGSGSMYSVDFPEMASSYNQNCKTFHISYIAIPTTKEVSETDQSPQMMVNKANFQIWNRAM